MAFTQQLDRPAIQRLHHPAQNRGEKQGYEKSPYHRKENEGDRNGQKNKKCLAKLVGVDGGLGHPSIVGAPPTDRNGGLDKASHSQLATEDTERMETILNIGYWISDIGHWIFNGGPTSRNAKPPAA